jgi:MFS-type transporter involved in bile tolerance (Atg22 family)
MGFFKELVSDDNSIDEKAFVGVVSFFAMVFTLLVDVATGIFDKELIIKQFIFDGFMTLTMICFGIATAGKVFSMNKQKKEQDATE